MLKNKRNFFVLFILFLLLFVGGVFLWQKREIKGSPEDYVIKETEEGKIVENKRAGLTMKVPEGWTEKKIEFLEGSVVFDTSDIEGRWEDEMVKPPLKRGCGIETAVVYEKMSFEEVKEEIKEIHLGLGIKSEEFEVIIINDSQVLKNTFNSVALGPSIAVYFTQENKLYSFCLYWAPEDKERCVQKFNNFLETVSIK